MLGLAFAVGSVPWSNVGARVLRGVDLRQVGSGTVSGTSLYRVAGFGPLAVFGCLEVAKGAVGPLLAGRRRRLGAAAAAMTLAGHNWSPLLTGAGGRGMAPALGATLVLAPEGTAVLGTGMLAGRLLGQTALGCLVGLLSLGPALRATRRPQGNLVAVAVVTPIIAKRVLGNGRPAPGWAPGTLVQRLLFDRDG